MCVASAEVGGGRGKVLKNSAILLSHSVTHWAVVTGRLSGNALS